MIKINDMKKVILLFFIGLGMFNAISTCIDQLCEVKRFNVDQTGLVGGVLLIAGVIGAVVLPLLSDKAAKRKAFILIGMIGMTPGLIGLTVLTSYPLVLISAAVMGFFLLGAGAPVGMQYAAEISFPAPESTTQGVILLAGQISGLLFVFGMNALGPIPSMWIFVVMAVGLIFASLTLTESKMIQT